MGIHCTLQTVLASQTCRLWSSYRRVWSVPSGRSSLAIAQMTLPSSQNSSCACQTCAPSTTCTLTNCWPFALTLEQNAHRTQIDTHRNIEYTTHTNTHRYLQREDFLENWITWNCAIWGMFFMRINEGNSEHIIDSLLIFMQFFWMKSTHKLI